MDYAQRQHEMIKKSNFCQQHPKELGQHHANPKDGERFKHNIMASHDL